MEGMVHPTCVCLFSNLTVEMALWDQFSVAILTFLYHFSPRLARPVIWLIDSSETVIFSLFNVAWLPSKVCTNSIVNWLSDPWNRSRKLSQLVRSNITITVGLDLISSILLGSVLLDDPPWLGIFSFWKTQSWVGLSKTYHNSVQWLCYDSSIIQLELISDLALVCFPTWLNSPQPLSDSACPRFDLFWKMPVRISPRPFNCRLT